MLKNLVKGIPHAPITLAKYIQFENRVKIFQRRTLEGIREEATQFKEQGCPRNRLKDFKNCEDHPLLPPEINGPVVDYLSVMPLHINLGLGLQFHNILGEHAIALDLSIRDANGLTSEGVPELYSKQKEICLSITESEEKALKKKNSIEVLQMQIKEIQDDYPESFTKVNGKYVNLIMIPNPRLQGNMLLIWQKM